MSDQLSLELRDNDLPPAWDGTPVTWGKWRELPAMHLCPPPKSSPRCEQCGTSNDPRMIEGFTRHERGHDVLTLVVHRCPSCELDTVYELSTRQWWTLDLADYTDSGSWAADGSKDPQ